MKDLITAITAGITAFCATNIDDLVILILFFSQVNTTFRRRHIFAGQYLGFTILVLASLSGFFGSLLLSQNWIGLLGLLPITIGLRSLLNQEDKPSEVEAKIEQPDSSIITSFLSPQTYSVAAITIANGGDNLGIYAPLFANSNFYTLVVILSVFFLLLGVWCYVADRLTRQQKIVYSLMHYGNNIVPFVLIGLGVFIVLENHALSLPKLIASTLCLMGIVRNSE